MAATTTATPKEAPLPVKLLTAGTAACIADLITFPLDTAKVRLQIQGEAAAATPVRYYITSAASAVAADGGVVLDSSRAISAGSAGRAARYNGMFGTVMTIARQEGPKSLYNGLVAGLQRQMCFASIRIGLYDSIKKYYQHQVTGNRNPNQNVGFAVRISAGITTGGLAVLFAQPTDVVKVRMQAQQSGGGATRYSGTINAYKTIAKTEGMRGLWKGTLPNVSRNAIVNVAEIVCYDLFKDLIISRKILKDGVPCHFSAAVAAGFCTTVVASPVDVVKTRFMNAPVGQYRGAIDCSVRMLVQEGPAAFYKGFMPSFSRMVCWNICMWITYEQLKRLVQSN